MTKISYGSSTLILPKFENNWKAFFMTAFWPFLRDKLNFTPDLSGKFMFKFTKLIPRLISKQFGLRRCRKFWLFCHTFGSFEDFLFGRSSPFDTGLRSINLERCCHLQHWSDTWSHKVDITESSSRCLVLSLLFDNNTFGLKSGILYKK